MAKLKYNIQKMLDALPRSVSINNVLERCEKKSIKKNTFYRDKAILSSDKFSIPYERLEAYSKIFNCSIEDLINRKKRINATAKNPLLKVVKSPLA
jgi:hypothetical protein